MKFSDIVLIFFMVGVVVIIFSFFPPMTTVQYNCQWSEISPDIPAKVKESCRQIRAESAKRTQDTTAK